MMEKCIRCIVAGRVQGVFFRESTRRKADELGVTGWVRNCRDGTVEVLASGDSTALAALRTWLVTGPPHARVTAVNCVEQPDHESLTGFVVHATD